MKQKKRATGGYSLIEVIITIAFVGIFSLGAYASINTSIAMNGRTQAMLEAEMRVKDAVETLMARGLTPGDIQADDTVNGFSSVSVVTVVPSIFPDKDSAAYYTVTFSSEYAAGKPPVTVTTNIKRS